MFNKIKEHIEEHSGIYALAIGVITGLCVCWLWIMSCPQTLEYSIDYFYESTSCEEGESLNWIAINNAPKGKQVLFTNTIICTGYYANTIGRGTVIIKSRFIHIK